MAPDLEYAVGVIERLARRVASDEFSLDREEVSGRVEGLLPVEAPLLGRGSVSAVVDAILGLGPLEPLLADPDVSDILVNSDGAVWIERLGSLQPVSVRFAGPGQLLAAVERVLAPLGHRLDRASPAVDVRLPDGSRLHAIVPPASVDGPVLAIRRFRAAAACLADLVATGSIEETGADVLRELVTARRNLLVCGATGSGKTTMLNVLSREIPEGERVVTIEDAAELQLAGHVVRLEGRGDNAEGVGAITLRELVRHALRLRPDRIIVGEVRGVEAFDMLQAMSTGHDGSMSTIHAGTAEEAVWRLETLALLEPAATERTISRQVRQAIDSVVVVERRRSQRVVRGIFTLEPEVVEVYSCS